MRSLRVALGFVLISISLVLQSAPAGGDPCKLAATASLYGTEDVATLAGQGASSCATEPTRQIGFQQPQPYFTYQIVCSTDRQAAAEGLCSTTPCPDFGRFFAFRTIHRPDGSSGPAGFSCVTLDVSVATPGVTVAQVFEAVRRVKLPGGEIGVEPEVRGLANLESFFGVEEQAAAGRAAGWGVDGAGGVSGGGVPVDVRGGGDAGDGGGRGLGLESEVNVAFRRRGMYRVGVTVVWVAEAFLDGRRVGEVDDLVSRSQTTYPVAELRTVLTG